MLDTTLEMVRHLQVNVGYCNVKASGLQGRFNHEETENVNEGNISFGLRICIALMCMCVMCMTRAIQKILSYVVTALCYF